MGFKETILFVGPDSSGKTTNLFNVAAAHEGSKAHMIDLENKSAKILAGLFPDLDVTVDQCLTWDQLEDSYAAAKKKLKAGDWLLIDGLDRAWDMVQADYERKVNGFDLSDRVEKMRLGEDSPGIDKWGWCKTKHNGNFMDVVCGPAPFNVAATAMAEVFPPDTALKNADPTYKEELKQWKPFGYKPGGEKRNVSRFDTVIPLNVTYAPVKYQISTYKDKLRPYFGNEPGKLWADFDIDKGFWAQYVEMCAAAEAEGRRILMPD